MDVKSITDCFYFLNHNYFTRVYPRRRLCKTFRKFNMGVLRVKVKCAGCGEIILKCNTKHCAIPPTINRTNPDYNLIQFVRKNKNAPNQRNLISFYCNSCYEAQVKKERLLMSAKAYELTEKFAELLSTCDKMGTCDVLSVHHELLKDDPERLTTEFLLKLVCNRKQSG